MANQTEIAKRAGVSIASVSRVLSGTKGPARVSAAKAEEIRAIAAEVGYQVNMAGRMLRTRKSRTIGLLFNSASLQYRELVPELQWRFYQRGYSAVCGFWKNFEDAPAAIAAICAGCVDGIITCHSPDVVRKIATNRPVVYFMSIEHGIDTVIVDKDAIMRKVTDHLMDLGHRRILYISSLSRVSKKTLADYAARGLRIEDRACKLPLMTVPGVHAGVPEMLAEIFSKPLAKRPTAIVCPNDVIAAISISTLHGMGIETPRDVSVVGSEVLDVGRFSTPTITTCGPGQERIADALVESMFARLDNPTAPRSRVFVEPELFVRDSTGPAPK